MNEKFPYLVYSYIHHIHMLVVDTVLIGINSIAVVYSLDDDCSYYVALKSLKKI